METKHIAQNPYLLRKMTCGLLEQTGPYQFTFKSTLALLHGGIKVNTHPRKKDVGSSSVILHKA